jgi:hypothetical protein
MGSDELAMTVTCPLCYAKPGQACVYMNDHVLRSYEWSTGRTTKQYSHRMGDPTKRPHNDRRNKIVKTQEADRRAAYYAMMTKPPDGLFELRALDVAEYNKTKAWIRNFGNILWRRPWNAPMTRAEKTAFSTAWDARYESAQANRSERRTAPRKGTS